MAKQDITVPLDAHLTDENGNITYPWLTFFGVVADAVKVLRKAEESMDTLTSVSTATEVINAWEEFREELQKIR